MNCQYNPTVCTYSGMQERLIENYEKLGSLLNAETAPVGKAWVIVRNQHPEIDLYSSDGKHPSLQGSYLAATVLYLTIFKKPIANIPNSTLSAADMNAILTSAREAMFGK